MTTSTIALAPDDGTYVLVLDDGGSHRVAMPPIGAAVVGRAEDCEVPLQDSSASRQHARIDVDASGLAIVDLGSRNGTRVNGRLVEAPLRLSSGDVITLGRSTLVVRIAVPTHRGDRLEASELVGRLERELARARRHRRCLAITLAAVTSDGARAAARARDLLEAEQAVGLLDDGTLLCILPELSLDEAQRTATELGQLLGTPTASSTYPADATDAGGLLAAARAQLAGASDTLTIGDSTIVVADPAMVKTYELLRHLAASDLSVLVVGETGAGKEMAAAALHAWSPRAGGPLVQVNCAALPDTLVESELFGHEKGAFSGADRAKPGLMERASGGTLFLDELGELPVAAQAKLLRAIEQRAVARLGGLDPIPIDFRLVAATNRDVATEIAAGRLRQDLYYRVGAALVELPPLRDRRRDIPALARLFLNRARARLGRAEARLSSEALRALGEYRFPGNVRELANAMEFTAATTADTLVEPWHLPAAIAAPVAPSPNASPMLKFRPITEEIEALEARRMTEALAAANGNQSKAAELIGMPRRSFVTKMTRYGLRGH